MKTPLRSRRSGQSPSKEEDEPLIVVIEPSEERDDPSGKKTKRSNWVIYVSICMMGLAGWFALTTDNMTTGLALLSGCSAKDCSLSMVTMMQNGTAHPCKSYCSSLVEWKDAATRVASKETPDKLYGSFATHGVCKVPQELALKKGEGLIPRLGASTLPDFTSLILHGKMKGKTIFMIGDSLLKQAFEVLPMVLSGAKDENKHYEYAANGAVSLVGQCGLDFKTHTQTCKPLPDTEPAERYPCNCTIVTTIRAQSTTIHFAHAYGIEYQTDGQSTGLYGLDFNVVRPGVIRKLLQESDAVVMYSGVIPNAVKHDTKGYKSFLEFVKKMGSSNKQVLFQLTIPQHFPTTNSMASYQDEERSKGACVEVAPARHWTDTLAQSALSASGVDVIDLFPIASTQGRFHSNKPGDCSQFCLGYDMFYAFWDAVTHTL